MEEYSSVIGLLVNNIIFVVLWCSGYDLLYVLLNLVHFLLCFSILYVKLSHFTTDTPHSQAEQYLMISQQTVANIFINCYSYYQYFIYNPKQFQSIFTLIYNFKFLILAYLLFLVGSLMSLKTTIWILLNIYLIVRMVELKTNMNTREVLTDKYSMVNQKVGYYVNKIPKYSNVKQKQQ